MPAEVDQEEQIQDVVFLGETRPVLLRLKFQVDGKPFLVRWRTYLSRLFAYYDRNGDGVLSRTEAARIPNAEQL